MIDSCGPPCRAPAWRAAATSLALCAAVVTPLPAQHPAQVLDSLTAAVNRADFAKVDSLFAPEATIHYAVPFGLHEPSQPGWLVRASDLYRGFGFNVSARVSVRVVERIATARFASEYVRVEFRRTAETITPYVWHYFATYQFDGDRIWRLWTSPPEPDSTLVPVVPEPAFGGDAGPVVVFDGAHGNIHLPGGSHWPLRELLRRDGMSVRTSYAGVGDALSADTDIFVILNALDPADQQERALPIASAFSAAEIDSIVNWVRGGGSLLLVADHMPWPGAVADLALEFGAELPNGYTRADPPAYPDVFSRDDGTLRSHAITDGRDASERVAAVGTFGGNGFTAPDFDALLVLGDDMVLLEPQRWPQVDDSTPRRSAAGLLQGAARDFGRGRIVILGEVAVLRVLTDAADPDAAGLDNGQFALNLFRWLAKGL